VSTLVSVGDERAECSEEDELHLREVPVAL
jgi:hypothetical protein